MLLIDGYNLLHAAKLEGDIESKRRQLIEAVGRRAQRARIVFDPTKGPHVKGGPVEIVYVPEGTTADDAIIEMLRATKDRTAYTVVTSDRAIADEARRLRFQVIGSREFWEELHRPPAPPGKPSNLSDSEVTGWMREFGLHDEEE